VDVSVTWQKRFRFPQLTSLIPCDAKIDYLEIAELLKGHGATA